MEKQKENRKRFSLSRFRSLETRQKLILAAIAVALVILILVLIAGIPLATNPKFCGETCHAINPEYQTWKRSSHAEIACHFCHTDQSYVGLGKDKFVDGPRRFFKNQSNSFAKPINADSNYGLHKLKTNRCLRCHSPKTRPFSGRRGLNVTSKMHLKHLKAGLFCSTCHNRVVHLGAEKYEPLKSEWKEAKGFKYKNFLTMRQGCWRCHSNDKRYRSEKTLKIIKNGKKPPTSCKTCHNQEWNLKPGKESGKYNHGEVGGIPWRDGKRRHGVIAKKDFDACTACHPRTGTSPNGLPNCTTTCHGGVTMPHNIPKWAKYYKNRPDTPLWRRIHFKVAKSKGTKICQKCHNYNKEAANFCQSCHHQQFSTVLATVKYSNWKDIHFQVVKKIGGSKCFHCHLPNFCAECHTTGVKPEPGKYFNVKY
jgi:nitrate/TMAO reductase-like tetraheme cytochrome c subunit